jgi:hypothetical protein
MRQVPSKCPFCGEANIHNLDYCAICGKKFVQKSVENKVDPKKLSKDQKLKLKKMKKKRELTDLYKNKKITKEQYVKGMKKLGYGGQIEKALAFKKYIQEQVKAFEEMEIDPRASEGATYYDPNEAQTDLPRDENGNVIVDFTAARQNVRPTDDVPTVEYGTAENGGPAFGHSLFGDRGEREIKKVRAEAVWDDDEQEDEFEIDLEETKSGWWDDEEWELDWTDEDEEELTEWELEEEEWGIIDDDGELEVTFDEDEEDSGYEVTFEDDEVDFEIDEDDMELDDDEIEFEDDDSGWDSGRKRRNR